MIPSTIAELVINGQAEIKNFCGGIGAIQTIQVPTGKKIILLDLFITVGDQFNKSGILHLTIDTDKNKNYYSFINQLDISAGQTRCGSGLSQPLFLKATKNVRLRWSNSLQMNVVDYITLPVNANEPLPPNGYGTTIPVTSNVQLGDLSEAYTPPGNQSITAIASNEQRNELFPNISATTALDNPGALPNNTFVFNLMYAIINNSESNKF
jgi:hypothetical protein